MRRFYALVARATGALDADPVRAAELEVEWWRLHCEHQHDQGTEERAKLVASCTALRAAV